MGYADWHGEPGYFRDVTRHFPADATVLDVGCGTAWLARHFPHYSGVDVSAEMVEAAQKLGRPAQQANLEDGLPFEDASFDDVFLKDVLEIPHVDSGGGWQLHLARHLKKAGVRLDLNKLC